MEFAVLLHLKTNFKSKKKLISYSIQHGRENLDLQQSTEFMNPTTKVNLDTTESVEYKFNNKSHTGDDKSKADPRKLFVEKARKIDRVSLIIFDGCFVMFNLLYWIYYLNLINF